MSSTTIVDHNRGILTTSSFQATRGFDLSTEPVLCLLPESQPKQQQTKLQHDRVQLFQEKSSTGNVGWSGLMEISRASGVSGILSATSRNDHEVPTPESKLEICCTAHTSPDTRRLVKAVIRGLTACQEPERALEGMGGTYFFSNESGRKVAIFKPCDEEPLAPNNPKGYVGRNLGEPGWKPTVRVGEAAMREVAAYLLDHDNFAKVPTSVLVRARHSIFCYNNILSSARFSSFDLRRHAVPPSGKLMEGKLPMKLGSLQEFVRHECDTTEMGPSRFNIKDVQRIGIFDVRLFNTDRHSGNILVRQSRESSASLFRAAAVSDGLLELIPIDHGFCLPETLESPYFEWLHWPQSMLPFGEDELQYISALDIEADKELLKKELPNLRPECLRVLEVSTTLLKKCAEAGLNLMEIGSICTRPFMDEENPSDLEKLCTDVYQAVQLAGALDDVDEADSDDGTCETGALDSQSMEQEDILFELDHAGLYKEKELQSPSAASMSSTMSMNDEHSLVTDPETSPGLSESPIRRSSLTPLAASACVNNGHFWKNMKARSQLHRRVKTAGKQTKGFQRPVRTYSPDAASGIFRELSEADWEVFMQLFVREVEKALSAGQWKQSAKEGAVPPMSCPRF